MDHHGLLNLAMELACQMMECGAEIYRVEDSVLRLMRAYGAWDAQIFAIPNCITVSMTAEDGEPITRLCRVAPHGTDLDHMELCNALCRKLCQQTPPVDQACRELAELRRRRPRFSPMAVLLGHFLIGAFFTPFFGGGVLDALCGGLCGLAIYFANRLLAPLSGPNVFFRTLLAAMASSLVAQLLVYSGIGQHIDTITIGALMILVPGVSLTTAMREVMAGDLVSGVSRTAESILTATAIALGTGAAMFLGGLL